MNDVLVASVIGAMATVLAPLIALALQNWISQKSLFKISKARRESIAGLWCGQLKYSDNSSYKGVQMPIEARIQPGRKRIIGQLSYTDPMTKERAELAVNGGFYNESFLMLNYKNSDEKQIQFGSAIFELSPNASSLTGEFHGFGRITKTIISGSISLQKAK